MKRKGAEKRLGHRVLIDGPCNYCGLRTTGDARNAGHSGVVHDRCWSAWMRAPKETKMLKLIAAMLAFLFTPVLASAQYSASLSWVDNSDSETEFRIERNEGGMWSEIATVASNMTTFADSGPLDVAREYCYRVIASNVSGASASDPVCGNTPEGTPPVPSAPTGLVLTFTEIPKGGEPLP